VGSLRGVSQTISYEISLAFILLRFLTLRMRFILKEFQIENIGTKRVIVFTPIFILLFISLVAETNRSPFDFAEGESELVSGFNVEYGRVKFSLIFLAEYGIIVFSSIIIRLFLGIQRFYLLIGFLFSRRVVYLWV
jgi:NADH-ubiquinone oxidoreductase chain 1